MGERIADFAGQQLRRPVALSNQFDEMVQREIGCPQLRSHLARDHVGDPLPDAMLSGNRLQAALIAALAQRSAGADHQMTELHAARTVARKQPAVLDETAADSGVELDQAQAARHVRTAAVILGKRPRHGRGSQKNPFALRQIPQPFGHRDIDPAGHIVRAQTPLTLHIDQSRIGEADPAPQTAPLRRRLAQNVQQLRQLARHGLSGNASGKIDRAAGQLVAAAVQQHSKQTPRLKFNADEGAPIRIDGQGRTAPPGSGADPVGFNHQPGIFQLVDRRQHRSRTTGMKFENFPARQARVKQQLLKQYVF
ncbi:hypothetical protein SDC9_94566 [bioreactor metagenome]|uniref:Uncharacterized protein n=1 Tax=bioreactor metagenome TaxID=1076179 RepID=A0A645A3S8_9ZZZZ